MELGETCLDAQKLYLADNSIGREFEFHFDGGTEATLLITDKTETAYIGNGIITGYMEKPGRIEIIHRDGASYFRFNEKKGFTELQKDFNTFYYPIPHPQWKKYEEIRLARAMKIECEYKILRLPYLLGISAGRYEKMPFTESISEAGMGNIIRFPFGKLYNGPVKLDQGF